MKTSYQSGTVLDVGPFATEIEEAKSSVLLDTESTKVVRMVLMADKTLAEHKAPGELLIHCIEGQVEFSTLGKTIVLEPGQLLHLPNREPHAVRAIEDSAFLLTIIRLPGDSA